MRQEDESLDEIPTLPIVPSDTHGCDVQANARAFAEEELQNELLTSSLNKADEIITEENNGIRIFVKHSHQLN